MKIAILGTRGIPNIYGGFEQFAEYLALGLKKYGFDITVYSPHNHTNKNALWKRIRIIHIFDPEYLIGTAGQFIYDLFCILNSRKHNFDIIYNLGYTSSSIWFFLLPKKSVRVTNMDGLEWKRAKYSKPVREFLRIAEKLAVKKSNFLIADSKGIKKYLLDSYDVESTYIPYGAYPCSNYNINIIKKFNLIPYEYDMLIARFEPENNIETILKAYSQKKTNRKLLLIGNYKNKFGRYLIKNYYNENIIYHGANYHFEELNSLRYFSNIYYHGHSVGGTNPSLLEAMAAKALIIAHNNSFNKAILENDAFYFVTTEDILEYINIRKENEKNKIEKNYKKIIEFYNWGKIVDKYKEFFEEIYNKYEI